MKKFKRTKSRLKDRQTEIRKIFQAGKKRHVNFTIANATEIYDMMRRMERWKNDLYEVHVEHGEPPLVHLLVSRLDGAPIRNWRHMQQIKNELVGADCEGVELYPAERRLIDQTNMYHLWVINDPSFEFPFGYDDQMEPNNSSDDDEPNNVCDAA